MFLCNHTSAGDGFAAFVEIKVFEIHFIQPAPNQSLSLARKEAEKVRSREEDIHKVKSSRSQVSSNFSICLPTPTLLHILSSAKVQIDYRLRYAHTRTHAAHSKLPVDPCATCSLSSSIVDS